MSGRAGGRVGEEEGHGKCFNPVLSNLLRQNCLTELVHL